MSAATGAGARTVVVGLGNVTLTDDGAGPRAAQELARRLVGTPTAADVRIVECGAGGLRLMESMVGFGRAIVLDALRTGNLPVGTVVALDPDDLSGSLHQGSVHDLGLAEALEVGRVAGVELPEVVHVLGVEVRDVDTFGEDLSPAVAAALPTLVEEALDLLRSFPNPVRRAPSAEGPRRTGRPSPARPVETRPCA
jgi:hydrogenase maturation protease